MFKTKEEHDLHIYLMVRNLINDQSTFNINFREKYASLREAHSMLREELQEVEEALDDTLGSEDLVWKMIRKDEEGKDILEQLSYLEACATDLIIEALHVAAVANKAITQFKLQRE